MILGNEYDWLYSSIFGEFKISHFGLHNKKIFQIESCSNSGNNLLRRGVLKN